MNVAMSRARPFVTSLSLVVVLSACGPTALEGSPCDTIGDSVCEVTALYLCDGSRYQKVADCHYQCVESVPTEHSDVDRLASQTWTCADGPHLVTGVLSLADAAELTIEAGTEVRFAQGARIDTTQTSRLVAEGTQAAPILFTSDDETTGGWSSLNQGGLNLWVRGEGDPPSVLRYALVERAVNGVGLLGLEEGKQAPVIEHSQLRDNLTWGVIVRGCVGEPPIPALDAEETGNLFINNGDGAISQCQ